MLRDVKYPAIDGLRFYAALCVFMVHSFGSVAMIQVALPPAGFSMSSSSPAVALLAWLADGHHGVDIFFIISGFLMARMSMWGTGRFDRAGFLRSRFVRIYPAFLASYVVAVLVYCLSFRWPFHWRDFLMGLAFLNAVPSVAAWIVQYNQVCWSLGYEVAFYLIVPLIAVLVRRTGKRQLVALGALALAVILAPDAVLRLIGLFVGALIGSNSDEHLEKLSRRIPFWLLLIAYAAVLVAKGLAILQYKHFYYLFMVIAALLFVRIVFGAGWPNRFFSLPVVRKLGTISYSFFLWHTLCINVVLFKVMPLLNGHLGLRTQIAVFGSLSLILSIGVAWISYRCLEQRYFRRRSTLGSPHTYRSAEPLPGFAAVTSAAVKSAQGTSAQVSS